MNIAILIPSTSKNKNWIDVHSSYLYKTLNNLKEHILNYHSSIEEREKGFTYYCKLCDYGTLSKDSINNYYNTKT